MENRKTTFKNFKDSVLCHLSTYKKDKLAIQECGIYRYNGENIPEKHILPIPKGESKEKVVKEYNVLSCLKDKKFLIEEKDWHRFAHHLNSSQMMCYNFFQLKIPSVSLIFIGLGLLVGVIATLLSRKEKGK